MPLDDIRYLFDSDRWATIRVLAGLDGAPAETWGRPASWGRSPGDLDMILFAVEVARDSGRRTP